MKTFLISQFESFFGNTPSIVVKSPGRINLIGEHIDYNDGFVLPAAIDKGIYFASSLSTNSTELFAVQRNEKYSDNPKPDWAIYIKAMQTIAIEKGKDFPKFNCVFCADLPSGAGLSSSSALCVGLWFSLNNLMNWGFSFLDIALLAQRTEQMTGIQCGLMDQFTITHGKKDTMICLDCLDNSFRVVESNLLDTKFILLNSKVDHHLTSSAYNERRKVAHEARDKMIKVYPSIRSFRDISLNHIFSAGLNTEEKALATYIIDEISRVEQMVISLAVGNKDKVATIFNNGHEGLSKLYRVTCPETDFLNTHSRKTKGIYAARQMGGGFGGCMLLFVDINLPFSAIEKLISDYKAETGIDAEYIPMEIGDGVCLI